MNIEERVRQLVEEKIDDRPDLFLIDVRMHSNGRLAISIDGDQGVTIQDCVLINKHVGFYLEEENKMDQAYNLEVSSPGIDCSLTSLRQYKKNLHRTLRIKLKDQKICEGRLIQVGDLGLTLLENSKEQRQKVKMIENFILFDQIIETKVLISFK